MIEENKYLREYASYRHFEKILLYLFYYSIFVLIVQYISAFRLFFPSYHLYFCILRYIME